MNDGSAVAMTATPKRVLDFCGESFTGNAQVFRYVCEGMYDGSRTRAGSRCASH